MKNSSTFEVILVCEQPTTIASLIKLSGIGVYLLITDKHSI